MGVHTGAHPPASVRIVVAYKILISLQINTRESMIENVSYYFHFIHIIILNGSAVDEMIARINSIYCPYSLTGHMGTIMYGK